jgi:hypothetical protein
MRRPILFTALSISIGAAALVACSSDDSASPPPSPGAALDGGGAPDTTIHSSPPDANAGDTNVPDTKVADHNAPDTNVGDTNVPDTNTADTNTGDTNVPDTNVADTNVADTNQPDSNVPDGNGQVDAGCAVMVTIKDIDDWCTITIDGGAPFNSGQQTVCAAAGGTVNLAATPHGGFVLGPTPWHDTSGDVDGGGDPGTVVGNTSSTTLVVGDGGRACAWACCPGTGLPCPTSDQCP